MIIPSLFFCLSTIKDRSIGNIESLNPLSLQHEDIDVNIYSLEDIDVNNLKLRKILYTQKFHCNRDKTSTSLTGRGKCASYKQKTHNIQTE